MGMAPFNTRFPQIGSDECRVVALPNGGDRIPPGSYAFIEFYCDEIQCDCRRVVLAAADEATGEMVAWISFGFERDDPHRGPFLDPLNPQSNYADEILALARQLLVSDKKYVARLERHYRMFKAALRGETVAGPNALTPTEAQERIAGRKAARRLLQRFHQKKKRHKRTARN